MSEPQVLALCMGILMLVGFALHTAGLAIRAARSARDGRRHPLPVSRWPSAVDLMLSSSPDSDRTGEPSTRDDPLLRRSA